MSNSNQIFGSLAWRRQYVASAKQLRVLRARVLIGLIVCLCGLMLPACRSSQGPANSGTGSADSRKAASTIPPFSTKEPDRYQAIRITSFTETGHTENSSSSQSQVLIARDGEKRREEYSAGASGQIVYLEIPAGRFIVLPACRMYADLRTASDETDPVNRSDNSPDESPGSSPDQLLNEAHSPATYEKLGTETLADRITTKYRVVVLTGADSQSETVIWIDEAFGIPVRSETISKSSGHSAKVTMELKDVKLEVDERLFSWPSDYRKVEARLIFDLIRKAGKEATLKQAEK